MIKARTLQEWLFQNPGPYSVCLFTVKPGENPAEFTAGRVIFRADTAEARDGVVVFHQHQADEVTGELLLVEDALTDGRFAEDGFFTADYANLTVPVEGFYPNVVVTVQSVNAVKTQT